MKWWFGYSFAVPGKPNNKRRPRRSGRVEIEVLSNDPEDYEGAKKAFREKFKDCSLEMFGPVVSESEEVA